MGDGHRIYWETCGNPSGKPAVVLHGGPGSGCTDWHRRLFDPSAYRVVLFDQRGCGRSTPHASLPDADLTSNTTGHLVADMEQLRTHLDMERWLVLGGSWGSTLALAYLERHAGRVSEAVLFGVTTGRKHEFDWLFRGGVAPLFPAEWHRLVESARTLGESPSDDDGPALVEAYGRLLFDPNPDICERAALAWCTWESATPSWPPTSSLAPRFADPAYRLAFARIVTHYVNNDGWIGDERLLRAAARLRNVPSTLVHGRFDLQAPLKSAWDLNRAWPNSELIVVEDAGHAAGQAGMTGAIIEALGRFA